VTGSQITFLQTGQAVSRLGDAGNASAVMSVPSQYSYIQILRGTHGVVPHLVRGLRAEGGTDREQVDLMTYKRCARTFQIHSVKIATVFFQIHSSVSGMPSWRPLPNMNGMPESTPGEIQILKNIREKRIQSEPKTLSFILPGILAGEQTMFLAGF